MIDKLTDQKFRLNYLYKIRDPRGKLVDFLMSDIQEKAIDSLVPDSKDYIAKNIFLKGRQAKVTSIMLIYALDQCIFNKGYQVSIISYSKSEAEKIFRRVKVAWEHFPMKEYLGLNKLINETSEELYFANGSSIRVSTSGRSGTNNLLIITELARTQALYPKKTEEIKTGALPTVHKGGRIIIESTAEGKNGLFYDIWKESQDRVIGGFKPTFFPWFIDQKNTAKAPEEYKPGKAELRAKDIAKTRYGVDLTRDQMYFYFLESKVQGTKMVQEYPCTPEEAFIASGSSFYNLEIVDKYFIKKGKRDKKYQDLVWFEDPDKIKEKERVFYYGVDLAEGLNHSDNTVIRVRDREGNIVASYKGKATPPEACEITDYIWKKGYYGIVIPERNNHGHSYIHMSRERNYPYVVQMFREKSIDKITQKPINKYGVWTGTTNRSPILDKHSRMINEGEIEIDEHLLPELYSFVRHNGKPQALPPDHDDVVMADAICCYHLTEPYIKKIIA